MPNHMHRRPKSRLRRELRRVRISRRARYTALAAVVLLAGLTAGFCLGRSGAPASGTSPVSPIDGVAVRGFAANSFNNVRRRRRAGHRRKARRVRNGF